MQTIAPKSIIAEQDDLDSWLQQRGMAASKLRQLTAFRHTFSHFHLDIVPMWLDTASARGYMDDGAGLWYNLAQPPSVGLAAPVERLLLQLAKEEMAKTKLAKP